jgi:hypothetical protein
LEPPVAAEPPVLEAPPVPAAPPPVLPVPTKDVTLEPSSATDIVPFDAVTGPSLARVLLEEVVYLA